MILNLKNWVSSLAITGLCVLLSHGAAAQEVSLRNNIAYDATGTPNLAVEVQVGDHVSLGVNGGFKSWPRFLFWESNNTENAKHWRHFLVSPEARYYFDEVFQGTFVGANVIYTHFNVGDVKFPFGLYPEVQEYRDQGAYWAGGVFAGYAWWPWQHWRLELNGGAAVGLASYERFECPQCGTKIADERKVAVVPQLGINVAYNPVARDQRRAKHEAETHPRTVVTPPVAFVVHLNEGNASASADEELYGLIKARRYHDAVRAIRSDVQALERVNRDAEAMNAYGIALYFVALDNKDSVSEREALELLKKAAREGSDAAAQNLKGIETYGPARKEYEAWKQLMKQ